MFSGPPRVKNLENRARWTGIRNLLDEDAGNDCPETAFILSFQTAACVVIPTDRRERRNLHKSLIFVSRSNFAYHRLSGIVCRRVICSGIT